MVHRFRNWINGTAVAVVTSFATPAVAMPVPNTRLVTCGAENCLVIAGHRANMASQVTINGHPVIVEGGRSWHVRLPLATVREWSMPYTRTIAVTVTMPDGHAEMSAEASLPIGLLGHVTNLAALVVGTR